MFEVNLGAANYLVRFAYPHKHRHVRNQKLTICYISRLEDDGKNVTFVKAYSEKQFNDVYDKVIGRKVALMAAIRAWRQSYNKKVNIMKNIENIGNIVISDSPYIDDEMEKYIIACYLLWELGKKHSSLHIHRKLMQ